MNEKIIFLIRVLSLSVLLPTLAGAQLRVVTTTMMVKDMVAEVGGKDVIVEGLMGPGVDPHLYKPVASDLKILRKADAIFYNGLMLEGKMQHLFDRMKKRGDHVYAVTERLDKSELLKPEEFAGHFDPHVWGDVALWTRCVPVVVDGLCAADPENAATYRSRGEQHMKELAQLDQWAKDRVAVLPESARILITSHDAFNYFGKAYGFKVVAVQGISTVTKAGLGDIVKMVDFIKAQKIKAIFVESSVNPAAIQRISEDAGVKVGGELFSDAMGTPGKMHEVDSDRYDEGTFPGMVKHNVYTVVQALK